RGQLVGADDADRLARLDEERLVVFELPECCDDGVKRLPAPGRLARAAVDHEPVRVLRHLRVEVVHEHAQGGFLNPPLAAALRAARGTNHAMSRYGKGRGGHGRYPPGIGGPRGVRPARPSRYYNPMSRTTRNRTLELNGEGLTLDDAEQILHGEIAGLRLAPAA